MKTLETALVLALLCGACGQTLDATTDEEIAASPQAALVSTGAAVTSPTKTATTPPAVPTCAAHCGGIAIRACNDPCTGKFGSSATCGQLGYACVGGTLLPPCASVCTVQSSCFDRCSVNGVASTCESFACDKPKLRGVISKTAYGMDVNRCVNGPIGQVTALPGVGVSEEFDYDPGFPQTSALGDHWQTVVRLPADPNRFFLTLNQEWNPDNSGFLGIMTRATTSGEMLKPSSVEMLQQNDASGASNRYNHPGGAQALGTDYVFVAEEQNADEPLNARIRIYQQGKLVEGLSGVNPLNPEAPSFSTFTLPNEIDDHKGAAAVAVAKVKQLPGEAGQRYLMLVASQNYSYRLYYWISQPGRSLSDPGWEKVGYIHLREDYTQITMGPDGLLQVTEAHRYLNGWRKQQNMNLLTDCDTGDLYLISWGEGHTVLLHKLAFHLESRTGTLVGSIGNDAVAKRDVNCSEDDDYCHWKAGAGSYVDAANNLQVYGTSKYHSIRTAGYCNGAGCAGS